MCLTLFEYNFKERRLSDLTMMSPNQSQLPHNRLQKFVGIYVVCIRVSQPACFFHLLSATSQCLCLDEFEIFEVLASDNPLRRAKIKLKAVSQGQTTCGTSFSWLQMLHCFLPAKSLAAASTKHSGHKPLLFQRCSLPFACIALCC